MKCPYTKTEIKYYPSYIKTASKLYKITQKELKYKVLRFNYGESITSFDFIKKYYIDYEYSLPKFKNELGLKYADTLFLLEYYNIKKRSSIEAANTKRVRESYKKTCIEKFGVDNVSKNSTTKDKKKQTFLKNYNSDNVFKTTDFINNINSYFIKKYGISKSEYNSIKSKELWTKKSQEEKDEWLDKSIRSEESLKKLNERLIKGYNKSKLESVVSDILTVLNIEFIPQFIIKHDINKRKFYDIYIPKMNLLIEINGDYWHANPKIYKPDDLLHYRFANISAKDIWQKDKKKIDLAKNNGYNIEVWWEKDLVKKDTQTLLSFVADKLKIYEENIKN
jgi:G:T-mismatch repair DNA endonuclease (very short patch repair protein)